ncbi:MAG: SLC13 family permease [Geminicoccaceae bacterium]|nr:MAG: SLC13 family permease [Geminicoccaceae bacterium]
MSGAQATTLAILGLTVALFLWGRLRHDLVATAALVACVAAGLVPGETAFAGFAKPAVVTVAAVLVLSRGFETSGAVDRLARLLVPSGAGPTAVRTILCALAALLSAFMNNVGALALLMPVAVQEARRLELPPGQLLMPLAFASILGGMTTLIGTPPNLIVATVRAQAVGAPFGLLDFAPVGIAVAAAGLFLLIALGPRLVPVREPSDATGFDVGAYLTEARVRENSPLVGTTLERAEERLVELDAQILGLVRGGERLFAPSPRRRLAAGDVLVIEAEPEALARALDGLGLELAEAGQEGARQPESAGKDGAESEPDRQEEVALGELVVLPASPLVGRSVREVRLRSRYRVSLLAIAREGRHSIRRLHGTPLRSGDVLLVQGAPEAIAEVAREQACVPLAERGLRLPEPRRALLATAILAGAVSAAASGLLPPAVAFVAGALLAMLTGVVPPRTAYQAIDWPVVVLLGAMAPLGQAMATTGTADLLARLLLDAVAGAPVWLVLLVLLVVTMTLSDFMNNAATAAVAAPIALGIADRLGASADPFLMAVAVGAACAFLTPIGHQNNTLILGPGGFRFADYWRLGLPLEVLVAAVATPTILVIWPP